jgi:phosphatidylserine/phosphatidylglycerophosphate/cardiolipin synthase-like enzyme
MRLNGFFLLVTLCTLAAPSAARAQVPFDQFCDPSFEDCRTPLLQLIRNEQVAIDVGMWFMEDARFSQEIVNRKNNAGVAVRILMDPRSNAQHPNQPTILNFLAAAGIPMRKRIASGIEHWKIMIFEGQGKLYFGSANFSSDGFIYDMNGGPYVNYVDETIYYTNNESLVRSFMTRFDDAWTNTSAYAWYANATPTLVRRYQTFPVDPELNIPPGEDFINRTVARINAENTQIDVMMYRIDDDRVTTAMINAKNRGVAIRLIVDPDMYRDPTRHTIADDFDRLFAAGIPTKITVHQGINHGKLVMLHGQRMTIWGSSNWTKPSANSQHENNWFTTKEHVFDYFQQFFGRRWNNTSPIGAVETGPFVPKNPDTPVNSSPANLATGTGTTGVRLRWSGGLWGQIYTIYFGTSPDPPVLPPDRFLGPNTASLPTHSVTLPTLTPGTTYYWRIRSTTFAGKFKDGPVWSFTTAGAPPPPPEGAETVVLWTANIPPDGVRGDWTRIVDPTAAGGAALHNPNRTRAKIAPALTGPANYFEASFQAMSGVAYHVWIRMRAESNSTSNDSIHVQFSDALDSLGNPVARIGTSSSFEPVLQDGPNGVAPQGWGWTDNGWDGLGPQIFFAATGTHTIRIQQREDGPIIDQIVLSPREFVVDAPGPHTNDSTILPENAGGEPPPPPPPPPADQTIVLWTSDLTAGQIHNNWLRTADATAAGGAGLRNADLGAAKIAPAMSAPLNYFEASFTAEAGRAYHVWIRARADADSLNNDSLYIQFNDSVTSTGAPTARIGTTGFTEFLLQAGSNGPAPSGWGWTDNGWGTPGADIYFATSGVHTLRVQQREDGITVDQIVISPDTYLTTPPGPRLDDSTILARKGGSAPPAPPSSTQSIVLWPGASASTALAGTWQRIPDSTAAGSYAVWNPNENAGKIAPARATPTNFFEMPFTAAAGTAYHVWIRMRAEGNSTGNDSIHLQFSDSVDSTGAPFARIGTTSSAEAVLQGGPSGPAPRAWGWTENGWETVGPHIYFATSGPKTLRVQQREDGAIIDQIVISPDAYLNASPGQRRDDVVILSEQQP